MWCDPLIANPLYPIYPQNPSPQIPYLKDVHQVLSGEGGQGEGLGGLAHGAAMGAQGGCISQDGPLEAHGC